MTTAVQEAPRIARDDAVRVAADLYDLNVSAAPLPSERDQNFYCQSGNQQFVLKIANSGEAFEFLELQNQLIEFLAASKISLEFPRIVRTRTGADIATIKSENGREHFVRLLTWLDGVCLADAKPHDRKLLSSLGHALAQMDTALAKFSHPAAHRSFYWDLRNARMAWELVGLLPESRQPLVARFFAEWERIDWSRLRFSVIHNDANDYNILVSDLPE
jgi:Ser/Thr protein kinase RdoA (MazF antagonist)